VIVVVDDLDRIDTASRWAFADALAAQQNFGVLFLGAHIPGFESGWGAEQTAARILTGLSSPVASTLLPARPVGLLRFDDGRPIAPMYVEQVLRYSFDGGSDPPSRLADLIALRVDTLEPAARRALQALAVLGDRTHRTTLAELVPKDDDLELTIRELSKSGLVIEADETVSTAHPLLREIVLGGIPVGVRRELHAKALGVGERSSFPIEASALHAYFAQESFQAFVLLEQVADRARTRGDVATEVLGLRRALEIARLEIARGQLDDPLRAVLIFSRKLGASLTRAGDFADAEGVLQEALDIAGPSGPDRARVLSALAQVAKSRNREPEALGYIDQAIDAARQSNAHDLVNSLSDTRRAWAS
jgi:serine/threonine-protein kinase